MDLKSFMDFVLMTTSAVDRFYKGVSFAIMIIFIFTYHIAA